MRNRIHDQGLLLSQLQRLVADKFRFSEIKLSKIAPDEPLIGGSLGFDELDALELGMYVEEEFGITMGSPRESRAALFSLASLAGFIGDHVPPQPAVADPTDEPRPAPALSPSQSFQPVLNFD